MPYLPPKSALQTQFPKASGADLETVIRMIEEKWVRHFPRLDYYPLLQEVTAVADVNQITHNPAQTEFDPLWGEAVDVADGAGWQQPHGNPDVAADNATVDKFEGPFSIHMRVQRQQRENELKKYGFDRVRDMLVFVPLSMLDTHGVTVRTGDKLTWDGHDFTVIQQEKTGYWKNTNVRLYMAMSVENRREGS